MKLPQARIENLLTTDLEEEVVVYDPERKQAHSLNRTAVAVWNHCDGRTSIAELQRQVSAEIGAPISETAVWLALRKLEQAHLLVERLGSMERLTRRQVLGRAGQAGAVAMATPIVLSAFVPTAAAAQTLAPCTFQGTVKFCANLNNCACLTTTSGAIVCLTNAVNPATAIAACTGVGVGDAACALLLGAGSTCQAAPSGQAGFFCTCPTSNNCGSFGTCVDTGTKFCHTACAAPTCTC
jgi:hypothetical protein